MDTTGISSAGLLANWLEFIAILLAICIPVGIFTIWIVVRKKGKGRKRKHRHHEHYRRQKNPSRAESGGLPPPRHPDQLPPGP